MCQPSKQGMLIIKNADNTQLNNRYFLLTDVDVAFRAQVTSRLTRLTVILRI